MIAPRFGFSWDMKGDGRTKLFGNAGRYFLPVANVINIKQAGGFLDARNWYVFEGFEDVRVQRHHAPAPDPGRAGRRRRHHAGRRHGGRPARRSRRGHGSRLPGRVHPRLPVHDQRPAGRGACAAPIASSPMPSTTWRSPRPASCATASRCRNGYVMANPGRVATIFSDTDCDGENDAFVDVDTSQTGWAMYDGRRTTWATSPTRTAPHLQGAGVRRGPRVGRQVVAERGLYPGLQRGQCGRTGQYRHGLRRHGSHRELRRSLGELWRLRLPAERSPAPVQGARLVWLQ